MSVSKSEFIWYLYHIAKITAIVLDHMNIYVDNYNGYNMTQ